MIDIIHVGMGPLGRKMVRYAIDRGCFRIKGAVDTNPEIAGRDLGGICGIDPLGINISDNLTDAMKGSSAQVAIVTTVSSLVALESQITALARAGLHIVSTCEELFFPWKTQPEVAKRIHEICFANNVACLGTGVNPGYLMDYLPTVLSGLCQNVRRVRVWRVQDASVRRIPFQQKIGAGLTLEEFEAKRKTGTLRHVGLSESVDFIADRLGFKLSRNIETLEPVIADDEIHTGYKPIARGMARGVYQVGNGFVGDDEVITLTFRAAVGEPQSYEQIEIDGDPPIQSRIPGGVNGDIATCAITLNAVRSILKAQPGLNTMADIPSVAFLRR
jgi:4-hydroxy-tetrahydrodipicolinate reductase